ncbi:MAG: thioredoxin fold domain-containing protein, partial [Burkholderiales bacterium]|nr:thioredoxin fold domain-containing protein [Burkholderiales bacterium]
ELMLNATAPAAARCETPIEKNLEFGRKYRISGTPTLFFANGERVPGAIAADKLEQMLAQNEKK